MQGPLGQAEQYGNLVKTVVTPGVYRAGFPVLLNAKTWEKVSPDLQSRLTAFLRDDFAPRMDTIWAEAIAAERAGDGGKRLDVPRTERRGRGDV